MRKPAHTAIFLLLLLPGLPLAPSSGLAAAEPEAENRVVLETIVARVNNDIITLSDLEHSRALLRQELQQQLSGAALEEKLRDGEENLVRDLIDQRLLVQRGLDMGLSVEAEVIKRLDRIREQNKLKTLEELERMVAAQGLSFEDFKQSLRDQIMTNMVIQREVSSRVFVDAEKVRQYYLTHREELHQPERVRLREILVSTQGYSGAELAAREERVREVLGKIRKGEKFEELARTYSDAPTAEDGGDLGFLEPAKLSPTIREVVGKLLEGGVSDPLETRDGWLILQLVDHIAAGIPPLEEVQDRIRERLYYQEVEPALREFLADLRRESYIKVQAGYVDTAAVEEELGPERRQGSRRGHHRRPD